MEDSPQAFAILLFQVVGISWHVMGCSESNFIDREHVLGTSPASVCILYKPKVY